MRLKIDESTQVPNREIFVDQDLDFTENGPSRAQEETDAVH